MRQEPTRLALKSLWEKKRLQVDQHAKQNAKSKDTSKIGERQNVADVKVRRHNINKNFVRKETETEPSPIGEQPKRHHLQSKQKRKVDSLGGDHASAGDERTSKKARKGKTSRQSEEGSMGSTSDERKMAAHQYRAVETKGALHGSPPTDEVAPGPPPRFPFKTDESDHAETPLEAYEDIARLLRSLAKCLGRKPKDLRVYDPYYCGGTVKTHLASLGFPRCYNEMEDFYEFAERGEKGPGEYDVMVTNPPYSSDHVHRLFKFCALHSDKPAFLLLPHFFYTEPYFKTTIGDPAVLPRLFFLCPGIGRRYRYLPPSWSAIAKEAEGAEAAPSGIAPFPSFWYCLGGANTKALVKHFLAVNTPRGGDVGGESEASRFAKFKHRVFIARTTGELPNELKSEFDLARKRPNPRARKKLAKKRQEMTGEALPPAPVSSKRSALWRQRAQQKRKEASAGT